ncbi:MAG: hypothetical protein FWE23_00095 [Chitinivibrionia bacterium]|nr:hypothetical protein [Chitinivibrionia bacterium]
MEIFTKDKRDVLSNLCVASFGASLVGGVMFNTLGIGENTDNAIVGGILAVFSGIMAFLVKGGK